MNDLTIFEGYSDPLSPPPSFVRLKVKRIVLRQNSVHRVADDYILSSDALSMFSFDMTCEMYFKSGACPKFQ